MPSSTKWETLSAAPRRDQKHDFGGEIPYDPPTIFSQLKGLQDDSRFDCTDIDLVILDGGINDVGVHRILDPRVSKKVIRGRTEEACRDAMTALLTQTLRVFPRARVCVTAYFPIWSMKTDLGSVTRSLSGSTIRLLLSMLGVPKRSIALATNVTLATRSNYFDRISRESLRTAIDLANAEIGQDVVALADVAWTASRSVQTKRSWLWGIGPANTMDFNKDALAIAGRLIVHLLRHLRASPLRFATKILPQDPIAPRRFALAKQIRKLTAAQRMEMWYASLGHPNHAGARRYAKRILEVLDTLETRSPVPRAALCATAFD
ncbi:MAG: hypothetical protein KDC95_03190 [Planctomycetes bacterium]|nr:hypothetical protein [Planctomycetota bacterium]